METEGLIILTRHGVKYDGLDRTMQGDPDFTPRDRPGSEADKTRAHITPESELELKTKAQEMSQGRKFDVASYTTSDHVRTEETAMALASGVTMHSISAILPIDRRSELGLGNGYDWEHSELPTFSHADREMLNAYVQTLFTDCFYQGEDPTRPVMSAIIGHYWEAFADSVERTTAERGKQSLIVLAGHAPSIDAFPMVGLEMLTHQEGRTEAPEGRTFELVGYQGPTDQGEFFTGELYGVRTDNPSVELTMHGQTKGFKLSDLRQIEKEYKRLSTL